MPDEAAARTPPSIRRFRATDAPAIAAILQESPQAAAWSSDAIQELAANSGGLALVCEAESEITGFLITRQVAGEAEILNLAIRQKARRQGHASALLQEACEEFCRAAATRVFLEVRDSNSAAIAFYKKHGFQDAHRRPRYYQNPAEAAICMSKKLTA